MPAVARANGADSVFSFTGTGKACRSPVKTTTGSGASTVLIGGIPVVKQGDMVAFHLAQGCGPDLSTLSSSSSTVFANGQGIGRIGDEYSSDNIITSGFPTVFAR
jgi:uncharacterized Zn-binding protein involved in type VI secretion